MKGQEISTIEHFLEFDSTYNVDRSVSEINDVVINPASGEQINSMGEIRLINQDDASFDRISKSYIHMKGRISSSTNVAYTDATQAAFVNNGPLFLFERARLILGTTNFSVEDVIMPGIASLMTGLIQYDTNREESYFVVDSTTDVQSTGHTSRKAIITYKERGTFDVIIPLEHIFGFCRTYDKILQGFVKELVLTRTGVNNAVLRAADHPAAAITLTSLTWVIPRVYLSVEAKAHLYSKLKKPFDYTIPYTSQRLTTYAMPQGNREHRINAGSFGGDNSRIVGAIIGFQTSLLNDQTRNTALFHHINLERISIELGGQKFPNTDVDYNFANGDYTQAYKSLQDFKPFLDMLGRNRLISYKGFDSLYPLFVFDLSKQREPDDRSKVMEIVMKFSEAIPAATSCHVLTFSDRMITVKSDGSNISLI
jgi:hypothetical protein